MVGRERPRSAAGLVWNVARQPSSVIFSFARSLALHPDDEVTDAGLGVESAVDDSQLRRGRPDAQSRQRGDEEAAAAREVVRHSMIWSARARTDGGITSPSSLAVLRFTINSYL